MKATPRGCESVSHTRGNRVDAPIAYRVDRQTGDKNVAICTFCLRETDSIVELVASFEMNGEDYQSYDPIGFLLLTVVIHTAMSGKNGPVM